MTINGSQGTIIMMANGFKLNSTYFESNQDGLVFLFFAWAERPFVGASNVPETTRDGFINTEGI